MFCYKCGKKLKTEMKFCPYCGAKTIKNKSQTPDNKSETVICENEEDIQTRKNINSSREIRKKRKVIIGNHVWIGIRVTVLYNTLIGDGSIIGAESLVKSKIPNNCIAAGNPAKVIKKNVTWCRFEDSEDIAECGEAYIHFTDENAQ